MVEVIEGFINACLIFGLPLAIFVCMVMAIINTISSSADQDYSIFSWGLWNNIVGPCVILLIGIIFFFVQLNGIHRSSQEDIDKAPSFVESRENINTSLPYLPTTKEDISCASSAVASILTIGVLGIALLLMKAGVPSILIAAFYIGIAIFGL